MGAIVGLATIIVPVPVPGFHNPNVLDLPNLTVSPHVEVGGHVVVGGNVVVVQVSTKINEVLALPLVVVGGHVVEIVGISYVPEPVILWESTTLKNIKQTKVIWSSLDKDILKTNCSKSRNI